MPRRNPPGERRAARSGHRSAAPPQTPVRKPAHHPGAPAVAESSVSYGDAAPPDATSGIAALRDQFRPEVVRWLFVGESSPAGGTQFYRANSNLFRATREAFAAALGEDVVPSGARFLHFFREQKAWLVDLADRPVNRMRGRPRSDAVDEGVTRMAELIAETAPEKVILVKASIAGAVRRAASGGFAGEIAHLPFPSASGAPSTCGGSRRSFAVADRWPALRPVARDPLVSRRPADALGLGGGEP